MSTAKLNPQSAAERRVAEAEVRRLITVFASKSQRLVATLRRSLRKRLPTAHEIVYEYRDCFVISFSPSEHGYEGVFTVRGDGSGVRLYFNRGQELPDPERLLQGTGGQVRWILVEGAPTLARPSVKRLIDSALALNRVPFARAGRGPVVVRPTSAVRRRQRRSG